MNYYGDDLRIVVMREPESESLADTIAGMKMMVEGARLLPKDYPDRAAILRTLLPEGINLAQWYEGLKAKVLGNESNNH